MYNTFCGDVHVVLTITRRMSHVEKVLLSFPEHPTSATSGESSADPS